MNKLITILLLAVPLAASADSSLPWMKDMAGDRELPLPWGIGVDYFTMDQNYTTDRLTIFVPGLDNLDPSLLDVRNETDEFDLKLDVWILPFLNVFVIAGKTDSKTNTEPDDQ